MYVRNENNDIKNMSFLDLFHLLLINTVPEIRRKINGVMRV